MSVFTNPASRSAEQAEAYTRALLGLVGDRDPVAVLRETPGELREAVRGMSPEAMSRREAPGKWSVRHVLRHLADSEIVWGWRLRMVIAHDRPTLEGYDQDAWADRLGYEESDPGEALEEFAAIRRGHLVLLGRLDPSHLDRIGRHRERGDESLRHMLPLYAGHDLLHRMQIGRIREAVGSASGE